MDVTVAFVAFFGLVAAWLFAPGNEANVKTATH